MVGKLFQKWWANAPKIGGKILPNTSIKMVGERSKNGGKILPNKMSLLSNTRKSFLNQWVYKISEFQENTVKRCAS